MVAPHYFTWSARMGDAHKSRVSKRHGFSNRKTRATNHPWSYALSKQLRCKLDAVASLHKRSKSHEHEVANRAARYRAFAEPSRSWRMATYPHTYSLSSDRAREI